ncbi:MAG TPA: hypothetical protein VMY99_00965 [Nevskiaceae bacterium]|nr:hypothetical protein [Nevskiaceae bacterium]
MVVKNVKRTKFSRPRGKKAIFIICLAVLLVGIGAGAYYVQHRGDKAANAVPEGISGVSKIDMGPPTDEEQNAGDKRKDEIIKEQEAQQNQPPAGTQKQVTPIITTVGFYDNNVEVSSYVPGVFEDGGTCTVTLTKGSQQVQKQGSGTKNVSTTQCPNTVIPRAEFSTGTWTAVVSYSSATAKGNSAPGSVEVP